MVAKIPPALVPGPALEQLPYGLFSVVTPREGNAVRFENGVIFESLALIDSEGSTGIIGSYINESDVGEDEEGTLGLPKTVTVKRSEVEATEFTLYAESKCSPIGRGLGASQADAVEMLTRTEQFAVEKAFWSGTRGNKPSISEADSIGSSDSIREAVANLQHELAANYPSLGVIHTSRYMAELMIAKGVAEARGGRLYTKLGTPIIAGAGYLDTDVIAITPAMFAYRSEIFAGSNTKGDLLDKGKNNLYGIAERMYLIGVDQPDLMQKITVEADTGIAD